VRADLSVAQQSVQAVHAGIKAGRSFLPETAILNSPNLVVCTVPDECALRFLLEEVHRRGVMACSFQEEDLNGETTAFATELISGEHRKAFRKCPLLHKEVVKAAA